MHLPIPLLTEKQRTLWHQTAIIGFIFGIFSALAFILFSIIGLDAQHIQQTKEGLAAGFFIPDTAWGYVGNTAILGVITIAPFLAAIFWFMLRLCIIPEEDILWRNITAITALGVFIMGLMMGAIGHLAAIYVEDPALYQLVFRLWLITVFSFNHMNYLTSLAITIRGYHWKTLPPIICFLLGGTEISLITFDMLSQHPDAPAISVILAMVLGSVRVILLAVYLWFVSHQSDEENTPTVVTP